MVRFCTVYQVEKVYTTKQKDDGCRRKDNEPSVTGEREQKGSTVVHGVISVYSIHSIPFGFAPHSALNARIPRIENNNNNKTNNNNGIVMAGREYSRKRIRALTTTTITTTTITHQR